ncbi:MAG TPA: DUF3866 family protein [Thermoleophilaceae bacterium]|nr:DUF3866 family protein [Thermoleophilaceae bacterium]
MSPLALRRGVVAAVERGGPAARLRVELADGELRPAVSYTALTGEVAEGDEVIVNCAALDLGLGSGGFDIVHANLTRGLGAAADPDAHVMKLNYTPLQHGVQPFEERAPGAAGSGPVAVIALHGQLAPVAWAAATGGERPRRIGYVQTGGGALPGALSDVVRELRERGLLATHITAGSSFGGEHEAITVAGAFAAGFAADGWDAAIAGPGPGILGSVTRLGHGGLAALDTAHSALALGCRTLLVPRMSSGDPRERHRGLSHHSATVLEMLLAPVLVPLPEGTELDPGPHEVAALPTDLDAYTGSGLPATTMGRSVDEDELFFRAALAGGAALAREIDGV